MHCAQGMFAVSIGADEVDDLLLPVSRRCRLDRKMELYLIIFQGISDILRCVAMQKSRDLEFGLSNLGVSIFFGEGFQVALSHQV